ncbi:hypothetical protein Tco_0759343 [Tanacetum coccineum]
MLARALQVPEIYETNALALSWGCPKTKLRRKDEQRDIPIVSDEILGTQSREFRRTSSLCVVPVYLPEALPENLSEKSSGDPFGYLRRHVPSVSCDQLLGPFSRFFFLQVRFILLSFIILTFPVPLHHMSSGSQTIGDAGVSKFDMLVYTSVLTSDEVKNLVAEYAIPLDLHPCVPPSGLTMNRLPVDKIVATSMSQFLKFQMAGGVRVGKGAALAANEVIPQHTTQPLPFGSQILKKSNHQKVIEYENERVLAAKRKAQDAMDKATGKRSAAEGTSRRTKKKKGAPLTFALDESEGNDYTRSGFETHHSASPLNTVIPDDVDPTTSEGSLILEFVRHEKDDADRSLNNMEDATEANSPPVDHSLGPNTLTVLTKIHMSRGEFFQWFRASGFPKRNPDGDGADRLTKTQNQLVDVIRNRNQPADKNKTLRQEHMGCAGKEASLAEKLSMVEKEKDDLLDKSRAQEDRIKHLEEALASKTSFLSEAESVAGTLKGDLERLTLDLSHAKIMRHNYVRHLLPTVFQRLLSSDEYKKSMSDVFNQAITAGWSEGVKVERTVEDAEAILAAATDYDPKCKTTFMSAFDALFTKSYPYVEKVTESFRLPLGDLQNMWPEEMYLYLAIGALDSSGDSCFSEMFVHGHMALYIIPGHLRSGTVCHIGHCQLDSSDRLHSRKKSSLGHWHLTHLWCETPTVGKNGIDIGYVTRSRALLKVHGVPSLRYLHIPPIGLQHISNHSDIFCPYSGPIPTSEPGFPLVLHFAGFVPYRNTYSYRLE